MAGLSDGHYTPSEELEIFSNWFHELWQKDRQFAESLVQGMIDAQFPEQTVDNTE